MTRKNPTQHSTPTRRSPLDPIMVAVSPASHTRAGSPIGGAPANPPVRAHYRWVATATAAALLFLMASSVHAKGVDIAVNAKKQTIKVGKHAITPKTTVAQLLKMFGPASRVVQVAGKDRHYAYDKRGFSFDFGRAGAAVEAIVVSYNPGRDKKAATGGFPGVLRVDGLTVTDSVTSEDIKAGTSIKTIVCMGPLMCVSNPKLPGMVFMVDYNSDAKVKQILFGFNAKP